MRYCYEITPPLICWASHFYIERYAAQLVQNINFSISWSNALACQSSDGSSGCSLVIVNLICINRTVDPVVNCKTWKCKQARNGCQWVIFKLNNILHQRIRRNCDSRMTDDVECICKVGNSSTISLSSKQKWYRNHVLWIDNLCKKQAVSGECTTINEVRMWCHIISSRNHLGDQWAVLRICECRLLNIKPDWYTNICCLSWEASGSCRINNLSWILTTDYLELKWTHDECLTSWRSYFEVKIVCCFCAWKQSFNWEWIGCRIINNCTW